MTNTTIDRSVERAKRGRNLFFLLTALFGIILSFILLFVCSDDFFIKGYYFFEVCFFTPFLFVFLFDKPHLQHLALEIAIASSKAFLAFLFAGFLTIGKAVETGNFHDVVFAAIIYIINETTCSHIENGLKKAEEVQMKTTVLELMKDWIESIKKRKIMKKMKKVEWINSKGRINAKKLNRDIQIQEKLKKKAKETESMSLS